MRGGCYGYGYRTGAILNSVTDVLDSGQAATDYVMGKISWNEAVSTEGVAGDRTLITAVMGNENYFITVDFDPEGRHAIVIDAQNRLSIYSNKTFQIKYIRRNKNTGQYIQCTEPLVTYSTTTFYSSLGYKIDEVYTDLNIFDSWQSGIDYIKGN